MKKILLSLAIACSITSCDIERLPYDSVDSNVAISDPNYASNALVGIYGNLKSKLSNSWINEAHRLMEYNGDNVSLSGTTGDDLFYIYNYHRIDNGGRVNRFWVKSYQVIYGANAAIENIAEGVNAENDNYLGEAYFLRAMMYLYLSNAFGKHYTLASETDLSVPLKLDTDISNIPERSTVKKVYGQIEKDLLKAADLMTIEKKAIFATREAAYALLSRLYLYMGNNGECVKYANKVIDSKRFSLLSAENFRKMNTLIPENNSEAIFSIKYLSGIEEGSLNDVVGGFYSTIDGLGWGEMYASRTYIDAVNYFPNDARKAFIVPQYAQGTDMEAVWVEDVNVEGTGIPTYQFGVYHADGEGGYMTTSDNTRIDLNKETTATGAVEYSFEKAGHKVQVYVDKKMTKRGKYPLYFITKCSLQEGKNHAWSPCILRYSEVLLNKAEALCKLNDPDAVNVLNELRSHRDCPNYTSGDLVSGRGNSDLLDVILDERRIELAYEGHRAMDLYRNKKNLNRNYPGSHLVNKNSFKEIKWSDKNIIQLIPINQINAQGNLVQNEI